VLAKKIGSLHSKLIYACKNKVTPTIIPNVYENYMTIKVSRRGGWGN
jgi:hypothetical protein